MKAPAEVKKLDLGNGNATVIQRTQGQKSSRVAEAPKKSARPATTQQSAPSEVALGMMAAFGGGPKPAEVKKEEPKPVVEERPKPVEKKAEKPKPAAPEKR